ncbi:hypothetical protein WJX73_002749 [Symbiochloris irregularis]|uniref:ARID domain-containing protein n=1 Tax=Symbiochloris irregularis TaxID=706552 RepID=A0AAW1P9R7_9CHLO
MAANAITGLFGEYASDAENSGSEGQGNSPDNAPPGPVDPEVKDKIRHLLKEYGSLFSKDKFDLQATPKEDFYDRLAAQQEAAERRRREPLTYERAVASSRPLNFCRHQWHMDTAKAQKRVSSKRKAACSATPTALTRQQFCKAYEEFSSSKGLNGKLVVDCEGIPVDLAKLHNAVQAIGGPEAVTQEDAWSSLMSVKGSAAPSMPMPGLKAIYMTFLEGFDQHHGARSGLNHMPRALRSQKLETASDITPESNSALEAQPSSKVQRVDGALDRLKLEGKDPKRLHPLPPAQPRKPKAVPQKRQQQASIPFKEVHGSVSYVLPHISPNVAPVSAPALDIAASPPRKRRLRESTMAQDPEVQQELQKLHQDTKSPHSLAAKRGKALKEVLLWTRRAAAHGGCLAEPTRAFKGAVLRARDSRIVDKSKLKAFRRSGRVRQAPTAFVPRNVKRVRQALNPADITDTREGPEFQAVLPLLRAKPAIAGERENRWLQAPILAAGSYGPATHPAPVATHTVQPNSHARYHNVWAAGQSLPQRLPESLARSLGLLSMGLADVADWTKQELTLYARAMEEYQRPWGPGFKSLLPGKPQGRVASLYYNAWKRRAIPEAQAWHQRQVQENQQRVAAEQAARLAARQEAARRNAAAALAQQQAHLRLQERQQLREGLAWLRGLARQPSESQLSDTRMQRRVMQSAQALATTNCWLLMSAGSQGGPAISLRSAASSAQARIRRAAASQYPAPQHRGTDPLNI